MMTSRIKLDRLDDSKDAAGSDLELICSHYLRCAHLEAQILRRGLYIEREAHRELE